MHCWLAGAYALDADGTPHLGRPIALQLTADRPSLRRRALTLSGALTASPLADAAPVAGTLEIRGRTAHYGLRFDDGAGASCELRARQELALRRPPRGFSVVIGEIHRADRRIGCVRLRLDPRNGVKGLFPWA